MTSMELEERDQYKLQVTYNKEIEAPVFSKDNVHVLTLTPRRAQGRAVGSHRRGKRRLTELQ